MQEEGIRGAAVGGVGDRAGIVAVLVRVREREAEARRRGELVERGVGAAVLVRRVGAVAVRVRAEEGEGGAVGEVRVGVDGSRAEAAAAEADVRGVAALGGARDDVDHAAERSVAVERRGRAPQNLDPLDAGGADVAPVGQARLRIAGRNAVDEDLHVLDHAAAEESARRDHRLAVAEVGVEEHGHAGDALDELRQRGRGDRVDLFPGDDGGRRGGLVSRLGNARGDDDLLARDRFWRFLRGERHGEQREKKEEPSHHCRSDFARRFPTLHYCQMPVIGLAPLLPPMAGRPKMSSIVRSTL